MKVDRKKTLRNFSTFHIVDFSSDFIVVPNEDILLMDMAKGERGRILQFGHFAPRAPNLRN